MSALSSHQASELASILVTIGQHAEAGAEVTPWARETIIRAQGALIAGQADDPEGLWFDLDNVEWQMGEQADMIRAER